MTQNDLIIDAFERIKEVVHETVGGLNEEGLMFRPEESGNSIAWLVWHLTRIQDDHIADVAGRAQIWTAGWAEKFKLPFSDEATGYGHSAQEVGQVQASADLLLGYYDAVHDATIAYMQSLKAEAYDRIVDTRWDPPVTLGVRLVSVISDDLQHAGQAAYVRGLLL
jgi:uncharacterized protein DUF664